MSPLLNNPEFDKFLSDLSLKHKKDKGQIAAIIPTTNQAFRDLTDAKIAVLKKAKIKNAGDKGKKFALSWLMPYFTYCVTFNPDDSYHVIVHNALMKMNLPSRAVALYFKWQQIHKELKPELALSMLGCLATESNLKPMALEPYSGTGVNGNNSAGFGFPQWTPYDTRLKPFSLALSKVIPDDDVLAMLNPLCQLSFIAGDDGGRVHWVGPATKLIPLDKKLPLTDTIPPVSKFIMKSYLNPLNQSATAINKYTNNGLAIQMLVNDFIMNRDSFRKGIMIQGMDCSTQTMQKDLIINFVNLA